MTVTSPDKMHQAWGDAYNNGEIDALLALYEDNAALIPEPGAAALTGKTQLRDGLQGLLDMKGTITLETKAVVQTGDLALTVGQWSLTGTDPADGNTVEMSGTTGEVLRRQADGGWLYAIDNPWGDALAGE